MKTIVFIIFLILVLQTSAQLPNNIINQNCFDSGWPDVAKDILVTNDAMYFLGDQSTNVNDDIIIVKTKLSGELIWLKVYGGSSLDQSMSIIEDEEGYIYIGAGTNSSDGDIQSGIIGGYDAWIVKLDTSGAIIWEKTFGGTAHDWGIHLQYIENGNILAFGSTHSSDIDVDTNYGGLDFWIFQISTGGEIINSKVFGSSLNDNIFSLIQTGDGGFFTAARAGANDGVVNAEPRGWHDVWLLKLDANLNIEWQKLIGGSRYDAGGYGVVELEDGGFIINGETESFDGDVHGFDFPDIDNQSDIWVVRIDNIGNIIWNIALGGDNWDFDSRIFPNEDGTFTVFGSTSSMNNGDVEGNHYYVYNPTYPGYDIWMVHLSENGEILDQRCFGNAANNMVSRGIYKKSDYHYLIAGTGVSRQADPNSPEAPTEGEVWCGWESESKDIWFFEIVDCEYFQPEIPANIEGEDSVCTLNTTESTYTTQIINPQYEETQWQMLPAEAGELTYLQDSAFIHWNSGFEGQVELSVRSSNSCGESDYSEPKIIAVRSCVGIGEIHQKQLKVYPNPAINQITFELPIITRESKLQIKDIFGKTVEEVSLFREQTQFVWDCSQISPGVYFYQIQINGEVYRGKIVVN